ncbi:hypothetical protein ACFP1Z_16050 [Streptomyces gamaensis]|uniref:FxLD family lantipeptide n=1 Tax=Streptomyces gamaensis TaxID=1763542 RepID=A0ABW0YYK6_9ACTN
MEDLFDLDVEEITVPPLEETAADRAVTVPVTIGRACNPETGCIC